MNSARDVYLSNINVICNAGGFFRHTVDSSWSEGLHTFMQNKIYYVTKGSFYITINGASYTAEAGDFFFIPAGTMHTYTDIEGVAFEKFWMHLDIYPSSSHLQALSLPHHIKIPQKSEIHRLFLQYVKYSKGHTLSDALRVKATATALLAEYIQLSHEEGVPLYNESERRITEILRYIEQNIGTPLDVPTLAKKFRLHPNHFIRHFKESTGYTPARYIKMKKMEIAKQFLEETDLMVFEIMEKIGEEDPASFSKQFKSIYSYSPRDYRTYFKSAKQVKAPKRSK